MTDIRNTLVPPAPGAGSLQGVIEATVAVLTQVLDAVPARVVALDAHEHLVYANQEFFSFTRLQPAQVLGQPIARIIGPAAYADYAAVRPRLQQGQAVAWEGWTLLAGVGRRYMREHLVPVGAPATGGDALPQATVVISLDVTELKLRDAQLSAKVAELEATEALKSSIVDHAISALVSTDAQGRIVEFNPAAEAMFGVSRAQVLGRSVAEVMIPPRHRAAHDAGMARVAGGGPTRVLGQRLEMPALRADGSEFLVEMVLWRTAVGGQVFFTASMFDLSEQHAAQAEIERQREALRQSEKLTAMGSLLAGVAHELNNPLAIVMGRASLLAEKMGGHPLAADAQRIHEAADRCGRIVRTFLNMARSRPAQRRSVLLNDIVNAAVDMLAYGLRSHGITVDLALAEALPEVTADADQIGQVVLNLMVNAQQALAGQEGERRLQVSTGLQPGRQAADLELWLRVADNGRGVDDEHRLRIFEPFFTTKADGVGTGLGLAVSRAIAREHGGDLVLLPVGAGPARGACFCLTLPASGQAVGEITQPLPLPVQADGAARLLVVDDEPEIADLLREMLEGAGYDVATAESGAVALALLAEAPFDAIVSDLHMPDVDGAALWRQVRQQQPGLAHRMLFVTGDTLSPSVRQFLDEARCASLHKPFARAELLARIREVLCAPGRRAARPPGGLSSGPA